MTLRKLPSRGPIAGRRVKIGTQTLYMHTRPFEDGSLGEVFIRMSHIGTFEHSLMDAVAILVSKSVQGGVPLEEFVDSFVFTKGTPSGPVQGDDEIKMCSSVLDYVFRRLAIDYLGRDDLKSGGSNDEESSSAT